MIKMKSNSIKYNHIAIEGNIGSGKTTLAKKLSKDLESRLLLEEFAENPFLPKFYKSPDENALPLELSLWLSVIISLKHQLIKICLCL